MDSLSRRTFLRSVPLLAGGMTAGWSTAIRAAAPAKSKRSKRQLVEALTGVHNFMVTTFHSNYELDADGLRRNIADHARNATEDMTIVICGGLGELFTISVEEHQALVEAAAWDMPFALKE